MTKRKEKLTEQVVSHVSESTFRSIKAIAAQASLTPSEYVRQLIEGDVEEKRQKYEALKSVFMDSQG